jgi:uncharacterized protein YjbI with pentapeptide repeats
VSFDISVPDALGSNGHLRARAAQHYRLLPLQCRRPQEGEAIANEEHVKRLKQGIEKWNAWRRGDERDTGLRRALSRPRTRVVLQADLSEADLSEVDLIDADLRGADLFGVNLSGADLRRADLSGANLSGAKLDGTNLEKAMFEATVFGDVDLTGVTGLEQCRHDGPSTIDHRTLQNSGALPLAFLRGVGLPDNFIDYLPSLLNQPIQHYSCFISYSSKDDEFANRIHADLQNSGVRCWFAPHDLPIGDKILDALDAAIRLRDKVVLILSEHSINSDWVEDEVTAGFEEERKRGQIVLFPVRLDDAVMTTNEAWAAKLRARNIGDFRKWKNHDAYKQSFEHAVRDLRIPSVK